MSVRIAFCLLLAGSVAAGQAPASSPSEVIDSVVVFSAADGTPLHAKLSVPAGATGRVPVVFNLHGAGPRNYDHPVRYRDSDGQIRSLKYYDYYARELARRGMAFFRMSKRGCTVDAAGQSQVDRAVFSKATSTVLLDDYQRGLDTLRQRKDIDPSRIMLLGGSEGTRLAPQLALRSPSGIAGLLLMSHQSDNIRDTVVWQNSAGPWRAIVHLIPAAGDGNLTRAEYDEAVKSNSTLTQRLPFGTFDADKDGVIAQDEAARVLRPRLGLILKAIEDRNDDFIWAALVNLSSAYLLDGWDAAPTSAFLLKLDVPIGIFHGELDGTTRVEGVRETEAAFKAAGKSNLTVRIYPGLDHDLGWTPAASRGAGPQPYQDAFAWAQNLR